MASEDEALGQLFFDQLQLRSRDHDPEQELEALAELKKKATFHQGMWLPR